MEQVNILIIGAGVIGLAIGKYLSEQFEDVVIVEKENSFGRHTSSRNSEVIHSGIYYPKDSLKAKFCVEGNQLITEFCDKNKIPYKITGKLIVASDEEESEYLKKLKKNGESNCVKGIELIDKADIQKLESSVIATHALFVPSTGILDTHKFMHKMSEIIEDEDGFILYRKEVIGIEKHSEKYRVYFADGEIFETNILINSAGIFSEKIINMLGITPSKHNLKIYWCKGEYYKSNKLQNINHLIYPVPDPKGIFLGIHLTINLNGEVRFGPNAYYVDEISYKFDEKYKSDFCLAINKYMHLECADIHPDDCGIRAKLQGENEEFRDFYIKEESDKGYSNFINLMGIESPGITSALAIGKYVKTIVERL